MDLAHALRLNNEGVMLLLENRDQEAVVTLTQSLNDVKGLLTSAREKSEGEPSLPSKTFIHHSTYTLPNLEDLNCFIYSDALMFSLTYDSMPSSSEDIHVFTSVIILNIALAYQRRGRAGNPGCLFKAEKMYEMVCKLLEGSEVNRGTALLVKLAAINNISQLRHDQGDYTFSSEGFQYLGSLISFAGENLHHTKCEEHVYKGMLMNALLVAPPDAAPAA
jgi:hypothetical protein